MVGLEKFLRQNHNRAMKSLTSFIVLFCLLNQSRLWAQSLPDYKSTDNTGMGRQERFESIENYMIQMSKVTKQMQAKLDDDSGLQKQIKEMQQNIEAVKKQISPLKTQMSSLQTEWEEYKKNNQGVSAAQWQEYEKFLKPLKEGEYAKLQQEVEALKLVIRSMEEVIKDQAKTKAKTTP